MPETASAACISTSQEAEITAALGTRSVVLVGMMGAGKSTIGRRLAARLRLPFLDADTEIEAAAGMSIPEIFEAHGEPHFRDGEARVIARLLDGGPGVLATGGGAFMREETRDRIRARPSRSGSRPMPTSSCAGSSAAPTGRCCRPPIPAATVERLIGEREPVYQTGRPHDLVARRAARKDRR